MTKYYNRETFHPAVRMHAREVAQHKLDRREFLSRATALGVTASAAYGMIGMYTWCLWTMAERMGRNPYAAFQLIGVLVGIQLLFVVLEGAWYSFFAEIAGFATGFLLAAPAAPGGMARLREKLRGR